MKVCAVVESPVTIGPCTLYLGDCRDAMRAMEPGSVNCCVTSPPYWGLRDYGTGRWEGGDPECDHIQRTNKHGGTSNRPGLEAQTYAYRGECKKCGAIRHDGQIGIERTPDEFVAQMVDVFSEVWRVLADDGTCWLNLGDSYAGSSMGGGGKESSTLVGTHHTERDGARFKGTRLTPGLKSKDLVGIPWATAFALRDAGWYLRSDIIWSKPNPMPESVTDRPTKAHEYLFLLAKGQWKSRVVQFSDLGGERIHFGKYLGLDRPDFGASEVCVLLAAEVFDRTQLQEDFSLPPFYAEEWKQQPDGSDSDFVTSLPPKHVAAVWAARFLKGDVASEEFLRQIDRCRIALRERNEFLIGRTSTKGFHSPSFNCDGEATVTVHHAGKVSKVDFSHKHIVVSTPTTCKYWYDADAIKEKAASPIRDGKPNAYALHVQSGGRDSQNLGGAVAEVRNARSVWTISPKPFDGAHFAVMPPALVERCIKAGCPEGGTVLDPFTGSGTTAVVAVKHGRRFVGSELNATYFHEITLPRIREAVTADRDSLFPAFSAARSST